MSFTISLFCLHLTHSLSLSLSSIFPCYIIDCLSIKSIHPSPYLHYSLNFPSISLCPSILALRTNCLSLIFKRRNLGDKPQVYSLCFPPPLPLCHPSFLSFSLFIVDVLGIGRAIKLRLFYWLMKRQACSRAVHLGY